MSPIASLTNLRRLVMSDYTETCTRAVASWSSLSRLTHLSLTQCGDDIETGLVCLSEMQELQEFTLIACRGATGAFMAHLPRSLKRLHVRAALWYDDKWGGYLAHLKQLESLSLEACEDIHARTQNALRGLSRLRELRMPYSWVGRHCPCFLETLTGLEVLDLTGCPYVTQRAVNHIKALTKLRELSLAHCGTRSTHLKDEAISTIVRLDSLERLALCEAEVTDKGLRKLLQLPRLDALLLRFCQKITKKAVTMLSSHGSLRVLDMRKCPRVRSPPAVEKSAEALLDSMCYICKTGWRGAPNNEYACDLMELGQDWTQGLPRERVTRRAAELTTWVDMLDRKGLLWVLEQFSSR